jgi:hypothetical protein
MELVHRSVEDNLYKEFNEERQRELQQFNEETKQEWEKALEDFARRYDKNDKYQKDDLIRQLTIKRDRNLETLTHRRKERERMKTAELFDQQASEMLNLWKEARQSKVSIYNCLVGIFTHYKVFTNRVLWRLPIDNFSHPNFLARPSESRV